MTVYLDMDGVIADFFGGVEKLYGVNHWKSIKHRDGVFVELRNTDFFDTLNCFEGQNIPNDSQKIVEFVKKISKGDWGICSSPLHGDEHNSAFHKRNWLAKWNFLPDIEKLIFTANKHKYAMNDITRKPNILIDDKPANIQRWIDKGGIGIRYQANEDDLEEYLFEKLDEAINTSIG